VSRTADDFRPGSDPRDWPTSTVLHPSVGWQRPAPREVPEPMPWRPALIVGGVMCAAVAFWLAIGGIAAHYAGRMLP
jgi:hypothetical protein